MDTLRSQWLGLAGVTLASLLVSAGCIQSAPVALPAVPASSGNQGASATSAVGAAADLSAQADSTPTPAETRTAPVSLTVPAASGRTVAVRRGPIAEVLLLSGRVAGAEEVSLSFPMRGNVDRVAVRPGQFVEAGDLLLEADSKQLVKELETARKRVDTSRLRVEQVQMQTEARRQSAIAQAQENLHRATTERDRVKAGPPLADRQLAESAVLSARTNLERAEADLARLREGATPAEIRAAEQQVTATSLTLRKAEAELAHATRGPDEAAVRAAEREVARARTVLDVARAEYEKLSKGPDPYEVRAAERNVERAQAGIMAAESSDYPTGTAREAALASARLALQDAQDRLKQVREGVTSEALSRAKLTVDEAEAEVAVAQDKLDAARKGPDQLTIDAATAKVEVARTDRETAEARLAQLKAGPTAEQVKLASATADSARLALEGAQARLNDLNSRPTAAEMAEAEARVAAASEALRVARGESDGAQAADASLFDLTLLQMELGDERAQLAELEQRVAASLLRAPFSGVVTIVQVQPGDGFEKDQPVVVLSRPGDPLVVVNLLDSDQTRVAAEQNATVQIDGPNGAEMRASVVRVGEVPEKTGRFAHLKVDWGGIQPTIGATVRTSIAVQQKENVLLVPRRAIRSVGNRRFVEYVEGNTQHTAAVELGILTSTEAEVVSGVQEGQAILLGVAG